MKRDWLFKLLLVIIILISCALLSVSVPVLVKLLAFENPLTDCIMTGFRTHLTNLYFGIGIGVVVVIFSILQLETEKQIKLVRFLLILSTMLTAFSYILIKSIA